MKCFECGNYQFERHKGFCNICGAKLSKVPYRRKRPMSEWKWKNRPLRTASI